MDLWHHHTELGYSTHCPSANNPLFIQKPIDILFRGIILMDSVKRFYCTMYEKSVISKLCKVPPICAYSVCPNYGIVFYVTVYIYLKLCQFILALLVYTACLPLRTEYSNCAFNPKYHYCDCLSKLCLNLLNFQTVPIFII